jgi:hypothetical protein
MVAAGLGLHYGRAGMNDPVTRAAHYNDCPIEVKHLSRRLCGPLAQIVQYVMRAHLKGEELQDLRKALFWTDDLISTMAREPVKLACMDEPDFSREEFTRQMSGGRGRIIRRAMEAAWSSDETSRKWGLKHMRDDIAEQIVLMERKA